MPASPASPCLLLTFDIEDWFQVENFKDSIPYESWETRESRVVPSTHRILDLLDSVHASSASKGVGTNAKIKATFFVLGWIAERFPELVAEIHARGHEIASHGYGHNLCGQLSRRQLLDDLERSKKMLEDITGDAVYGYRAPSFSISDDALKLVQQSGYRYDSSYNSFKLHHRYGQCETCRSLSTGASQEGFVDFFELNISNLRLNAHVIPWGGGAYFRLIPLRLFLWGIQSILKHHSPYVMYLHPWEFDPHQPKILNSSWQRRFRHYTNLSRTLPKLEQLIERFAHHQFMRCDTFLNLRST